MRLCVALLNKLDGVGGVTPIIHQTSFVFPPLVMRQWPMMFALCNSSSASFVALWRAPVKYPPASWEVLLCVADVVFFNAASRFFFRSIIFSPSTALFSPLAWLQKVVSASFRPALRLPTQSQAFGLGGSCGLLLLVSTLYLLHYCTSSVYRCHLRLSKAAHTWECFANSLNCGQQLGCGN